MAGRTDRRGRLICLLAAFILLSGAVGARLAYWQVVRGAELRGVALAQLERAVEQLPERGKIFDRNGTVIASNAYQDRLAAYPDRIPAAKRGPMVARLTRILGLKKTAAAELAKALNGSSSYAVLQPALTAAQSDAIRAGLADGSLTALELGSQSYRFYPTPGGVADTTLASQLIGFVDSRGEGQYGVEQRYQAALAGRPRVSSALQDSMGREIADSARVLDPGSPGADLRLTLDASLQLLVEKELYAAWVANGATSVSAVVLDPDNGEVLAWATVPGYDANRYRQVARQTKGLFQDPVVSRVYEPGSVMKMLVAAAGLENGTVTLKSSINDSGSLQIGSQRVDDSDKRAMGNISFEDVIAYSRNVGAARVAMRLGEDTAASSRVLYGMWRRLGFGERTGVDVAGELPGLVEDPAVRPWQPIDLANRSFGQGVAATPLQLATAFSAMVNGGYRVSPHVVSSVGDEVVAAAPRTPVLSRELAARLRKLMVHVVSSVPWYAEGTLIPGYTVGGKTGTAQIWDSKRGRWVPNTFNFSFVGFVGSPKARAVIAVQIHRARPRIKGQGNFELGVTSYELFRHLALNVISRLDIPPDQDPRSDPQTAGPPGP